MIAMTEQSLSVVELCDAIAEQLARLGRPTTSKLRSGSSSAALDRHERALKLKFPDELRQLYGWRNGTATSGVPLSDTYFVPWMYFCALEAAAAHYDAIAREAGWKRTWFPIFLSGGAGRLAIDADEGRLVHWSAGAQTKAQYLSVRSMLATWLECYRAGCFFVEGDRLKQRNQQFREIGMRHNPGLDYWREAQT